MGFWKGRDVLVTGADGFIGSHLTERMVSEGANVFAFVRASSSGELKNILHLRGKITAFKGNFEDYVSVRAALKRIKEQAEGPLTVFHLGAQAHVGESWERPVETFMANALAPLHILEAIRELDIDLHCFDFAGTSEEYGNPDPAMKDLYKFRKDGTVIFDEKSPLNPKSPYATAKVAGDYITRNYHDGHGLPTLVVRLFNNYGPRQNPRYVTGTIITQALKRKFVELGALEPTRDFTYVADGVRGHMLAAEKGKPGQVYCFGFGKDISIGDWTKLIIQTGEKMGYWKGIEIKTKDARLRPGKSDISLLGVNFSKAKKELGWEPKVSREEGVRKTIEYYAKTEEKWLGRVDW